MEAPHRDQVAVLDGSDIAFPESDECFGFSGRGHELDVEPAGLVRLDDGTEIALPEMVLRQIVIQNDHVEDLVLHGLAGKSRHEPRNVFAVQDDPDTDERRLTPRRPDERTTDLVLATVWARRPMHRGSRGSMLHEVAPQPLPNQPVSIPGIRRSLP